MELLIQLIEAGSGFIPLGVGIIVSLTVIWFVDFFIFRKYRENNSGGILPHKLVLFILFIVILFQVIILSPMSDTLRQQILNVLGVVMTAVIAVSSTTFVSNAMAGIMLRLVGSFKPGDFVRIGEQFGKVSELGIFHTEIQTEDRDLATLPNLKLVTNPVTVVHRQGTIISANISLGYDEPAEKIEQLLKKAVENAGLSEGFVLIKELGDHSITYRASGFYAEIKQLLTAKSDLHKSILKTLHDARVEIVSPTFMNQRRLDPEKPVIPDEPVAKKKPEKPVPESFPEDIMFDKAHQAELVESLKERKSHIEEKIALIQSPKKSGGGTEAEIKSSDQELASLENQLEVLTSQIELAVQAKSKPRSGEKNGG